MVEDGICALERDPGSQRPERRRNLIYEHASSGTLQKPRSHFNASVLFACGNRCACRFWIIVSVCSHVCLGLNVVGSHVGGGQTH